MQLVVSLAHSTLLYMFFWYKPVEPAVRNAKSAKDFMWQYSSQSCVCPQFCFSPQRKPNYTLWINQKKDIFFMQHKNNTKYGTSVMRRINQKHLPSPTAVKTNYITILYRESSYWIWKNTYMLQFSEKHYAKNAFHSFRSNPDSVLQKLKVLLNTMIHSFSNRKIQQFSDETFIPSLNKWCLKFLFLF